MIHNHCKIKDDHYWGVGYTSPRPTLAELIAHGMTRKRAQQVRSTCHDAVLLMVGEGWEESRILLTPREARELSEVLLARASDVEARTGTRLGDEETG